MIRIVNQKVGDRELFCPVVFCDHCGEPITDGKQGNFEYPMNEALDLGGTPVLFAHKQCSRALERERSTKPYSWGWMPLSYFPIYLGDNLEIDRKEARESAQRLAEIRL